MSKRLSQADRLRQYNRWRRGDDSIPQPDPRELGELLDCVVDRLEVLERGRDALCQQLDLEKREHIEMKKYILQLECAVATLRQRVVELEQDPQT